MEAASPRVCQARSYAANRGLFLLVLIQKKNASPALHLPGIYGRHFQRKRGLCCQSGAVKRQPRTRLKLESCSRWWSLAGSGSGTQWLSGAGSGWKACWVLSKFQGYAFPSDRGMHATANAFLSKILYNRLHSILGDMLSAGFSSALAGPGIPSCI